MMTDYRRIGLLVLIALLGAGCSKEEPPVKPVVEKPPVEKPGEDAVAVTRPATEDDGQANGKDGDEKPVPPTPVNPIEDPPVIGTPQAAFNFPRPPLEMPKVLLTVQEESSSTVKVGDTMPELTLPDLEGKPQALSKLRGDKLTVVVFWNSQHPYAVEEIGDLGPAVLDRFGGYGLNVVGIAEREPSASAKATAEKAGAKFINLVDADGKALAQVASGELPRTYLLDASGKVLWFDLEYSRSTRRDLVRAIQFALLNDK